MQRLLGVAWAMVALLWGTQARAQTAQQVFGRNRIQYSQHTRSYVTSTNFDVYYQDGSEEFARHAAVVAEREFTRISDLIGYSPYNRLRIFLYDSPLLLSESNVGLERSGTILGGRTSFIRNIVEVAYTSSQDAFRIDLAHGLARAMIFDMMYGGSFTEAVQNSYLLMLPDWFTEGAALYAAEGWSLSMDNWARDAALAHDLRRPSAKTGRQAALMGQSIWAFIVDRYGRSNMSNILNLTRIIRNEETAISSTLGVGYTKVLREWRASYESSAQQVEEYLQPLPDKSLLPGRIRTEAIVSGLAISSDGNHYAWATELDGRIYLKVRGRTGQTHTIFWQGERHEDAKAMPTAPVAFAGNGMVATVHHKRGKMEFLVMDLHGKVQERHMLEGIDQVSGLAFSPDGKKAVLAGADHGQTDIYQINPKTGKIRALTSTPSDELEPIIDSKGTHTYFASNATLSQDTLGTAKNKPVPFRIYRQDLAANSKPQLVGLAPGNLHYPMLHPQLGLVALSDQSGALNIIQADTLGGAKAVTRFGYSLERAAMDTLGRAAALVSYDGRHKILALDSLQAPATSGLLPTTIWRQAHPLAVPAPPIPIIEVTVPVAPPTAPVADKAVKTAQIPASPLLAQDAKPDTNAGKATVADIDIRYYVFDAELPANQPKTAPAGTTAKQQQATANVNFNAPISELKRITGRQLQQKEPIIPKVIVQGPYPAPNRLSSSNVVTSFMVDPYRGWGAVMEAGLSDYFDNHRFRVRATPFLDLRSSILQFEYEYLKHRVDFGTRFTKNAIFVSDNSYTQKNILYQFQAWASYPFSRAARVSLIPAYSQTNYVNLLEINSGSPTDDKTRSYAGGKLEFVYDDSYTSASNITTGTKARAYVDMYQGVRHKQGNFGSVFIDVRRYQRIHKEITLAIRGSAGRFFGPAKKSYMIGGMDNWVFQKYQDHTNTQNGQQTDPLFGSVFTTEGHVDWLFNQFVTNLRGFDYNAMYGNNFLLFNAELRVPLVKYLYKGPIASNFLRNFQLVGFYDAGSAWSGKSLLSKDNSINTNVKVAPPFTITTINYQNPFLMGYGVGARTMLLGYYVKVDYAWGVQNYKTVNNRLYLTLGYDF